MTKSWKRSASPTAGTASRRRCREESSSGARSPRALAVHPAIVLADEPTGNLDAENSAGVVQLLKKASDLYHQTIVMVTHDRQSADYADRILTIRDGVPEQEPGRK